MNVFVLCTGRCGSETFAKACRHITNYTATHETHNRWRHPSVRHPYRTLKYPTRHIEVDNRLSWFLGTLQKEYGDNAFYVHLLRRPEEVARSYVNRGEESILFAFSSGVLQHFSKARTLSEQERYQIGLQYWRTVNDNIELFLRDKTRQTAMWLHDIKDPFTRFWEMIEAEGNLEAALAEWDVRHNATRPAGMSEFGCRVRLTADDLGRFLPPRGAFILVDEDQFRHELPTEPRAIPFLERDGQYWGPPPDDATAIREVERLRQRGASFMVFSWIAFWWLDHFTELRRHLLSAFRCILENDRVIVFDLRS